MIARAYDYTINTMCCVVLVAYFLGSFWMGAYNNVLKDMVVEKIINMNLVELGNYEVGRL